MRTRIPADELRALLDRDGDSLVVVDIRPDAEREWTIPGSVGLDAYTGAR